MSVTRIRRAWEGRVWNCMTKFRISVVSILALATLSFAPPAGSAHAVDRSEYRAPRAAVAPTVDGIADEAVWATAEWRAIDQLWLGPEYSAQDFQGRYKVVWGENRIYILAEIVDDVLIDTHRDPLMQYWDDDCLEIFIDEDFSGGDHQYNHNAFAYHLSLDNQAIDIGTDKQARSYTDHVSSRWQQHSNHIVWEVALDIYADDYVDDAGDNSPTALAAGKIIGLMLAWCDNDGSELRENFIGSETVPTGSKDRGWIDAGLFGALLLVGEP